jgi:hypothetical protein
LLLVMDKLVPSLYERTMHRMAWTKESSRIWPHLRAAKRIGR